MKCWKCGKENAEDDIFCIYCGSKLKEDQTKTETGPEERSVQSILEEYLPQLSQTPDDRGGFVIAPNIGSENCQQRCGELLKDALPGCKNLMRENSEKVIKSISENGETLQGVYATGFSKLNYMPAVWFFSDRALYAFWNGQPAWYLMNSGKKKKCVRDCKCRYDAIDRVSVIPTNLSEGYGGLWGTSKVSCSLLNNTNLFEFAFENKYIREDKLVEMIMLLKNR